MSGNEANQPPAPRVSVVVATRDRAARLRGLLAGLRAQSLRRDAFEVIVVADAADPEVLEALVAERARGDLDLRVVRHETPRGPGGARNAGWRAAHAPLVAFTDDDCVPAPQWLEQSVAAAQPRVFVQGRTEPAPGERSQQGVFSRTLSVGDLGGRFETCNILYPREALESLGGFDEGFGLAPGGEDTDLGWRAIAAGWRPAFARDAVVFHAVERLGVRGTLRVAARWSATTRIFALHPETRKMLYRGVFWDVWHYLMWRSLLALIGPAWLARMLVTRHLVELRKRARRAGAGSWAVPFYVVHDLVECWAVARGAIRHRTLVL